MSLYDPRNRKELFLNGVLRDSHDLPEPQNREEIYLKAIAEKTPIAIDAEVVQTTGNSATDVMSQRATTELGDDLRSDIFDISSFIDTDLTYTSTSNRYINLSGVFVDGVPHFVTSDYIDVSAYRYVRVTASAYTNRLYYAFYKLDYTFISGRQYENGVSLNDEVVKVPAGAKWIAAETYYTEVPPVVKGLTMEAGLSSEIYTMLSDKVSKQASRNLFDPSQAVSGYINTAGGAITSSTTYKTSDFIPIANGQSIVFKKHIRKYLAYNTSKTAIGATFQTYEQSAGWTTTATADGYFRFSYWADEENTVMVEYGTVPTEYIPYASVFENSIYLSESMIEEVRSISGNSLYKKKWCACGDSFTSGDFTGLEDGYTFTDDPYKGQNKVYPFYIGRLYNMIVTNVAAGGMTICPTNRPGNYFAPAIYEAIPADTDYITLAFGINDVGVANPIGTISDATDATFYGAWNVVLNYLITNHPYAKIGIIITNGISNMSYHDAIVAVAGKWGIPYIDILCDEQVPLMNRCLRAHVDAAVQTIRNNNFRVSISNLHPNVKAHEYESSFISEWLKTL